MIEQENASGAQVPCISLLDALDDFGKRGGRMVFWTCPKGCRDIVNWSHDGGKSIATCRKCGTSNAEGESRAASARTLHPLVGRSESEDLK